MPRSNYIYILSSVSGEVLVPFTVKHELVSYIVDHGFLAYRVQRFRDAQPGTGVDVTAEIKKTVAAFL